MKLVYCSILSSRIGDIAQMCLFGWEWDVPHWKLVWRCGDSENQVWRFLKLGVEILDIRCENFENQVWKFWKLGVKFWKSGVEILHQMWKFWKSGVEILKIRCRILKIRCGNLENQVWKFWKSGVEAVISGVAVVVRGLHDPRWGKVSRQRMPGFNDSTIECAKIDGTFASIWSIDNISIKQYQDSICQDWQDCLGIHQDGKEWPGSNSAIASLASRILIVDSGNLDW